MDDDSSWGDCDILIYRSLWHLLSPWSETFDLKLPSTSVNPPWFLLPSLELAFSPTSCYFTPTSANHTYEPSPPCPTLSFHPPPPCSCVWGKSGLNGSLELKGSHSWFVTHTGGHVTHQRPCCTHATLPLHILWYGNTHTRFSGAG